MDSPDDADLLPIQDAAKRFNVSVASLHKYASLGRIRKYRKGFDRLTYVDSRQLEELSSPTTASWFVLDVPIGRDSGVCKRLVAKLDAQFPQRGWQLAGWQSFVLVNGARTHPYTALKYRAHDQKAILGELTQVFDEIDPKGRLIDRRKVAFKDFPFDDGGVV